MTQPTPKTADEMIKADYAAAPVCWSCHEKITPERKPLFKQNECAQCERDFTE